MDSAVQNPTKFVKVHHHTVRQRPTKQETNLPDTSFGIRVIYHKKGLYHRGPSYRFPIGTISKVKKIVLGLRYKGTAYVTLCKIFFYVIKHVFKTLLMSFPKNQNPTI